jgi:predicted RNase H-like HicB family nuclease
MGYRAPMKIELDIHLAHDEEADVWYVAASDIPGLFLEAATPQALIARLAEVAPELIELNLAEILKNHEAEQEQEAPKVSLRPVFNSPLDLVYA